MQGRKNRQHANGRFNGTAGVPFIDPTDVLSPAAGNARPWTVARTGVGLYTVTLQVPLALAEREVSISSRTLDVTVFNDGANETAATLRFVARTTGAVPAAADANVDFEVIRNGG